ncbi:hypothetical protein [Shimia sagamensis]|uniref:hypothetical protein n=1 Tax=Shimia sagamensis TaxID=1566352 RepID=UPI0024B75BF0|nr:hypothetical protein [Shimia sagamensis]
MAQTNDVSLAPDMPADVIAGNPIGNYEDYNIYSWLSFVALNWPVGENGQPDVNSIIGQNGDNSTVWETWMEDYQILVEDGEVPPTWQAPRAVPPVCGNTKAQSGPSRTIRHVSSKTGAVVSLTNQADAGPLIDQNGNYVRYEILFNEIMYNYIVQNKLYTLAGLSDISEINFPAGASPFGNEGATEVKASWKILGKGDDPSRFHVATSYVYDQAENTCASEMLGLVGFHIATKTNSAPQWIWSTFEHIDNAPDKGNLNTNKHYSFYSSGCLDNGSTCKANQLPEMPWNPTQSGQTPVQVVREAQINGTTTRINAHFQGALKAVNPHSVWGNYILVGTQYPQKPSDPTDPQGRPFPPYLANTTMETFLQGEVPTSSSSCIGCHSGATASNSGKPTDFTFILSRVTAKD